MTRFGVMKHLRVLEEANLVVTRREGRFKHHYLNALPIQEVADRWMAPYGKPLARFALDVKNRLETTTMADKPDLVLATYIRTTPGALWDAIVNPEKTRHYYYGGRVQPGDMKVGGRFSYLDPSGEMNLDGEIVEIDPPRKLVTTFKAMWAPDGEVTRVMYEIEPMGEVCKLTLTHFDVEKSKAGAIEGWAIILSGLKTYLETGRDLDIPIAD
jgi:uncharacterized protein YndB with AHSA1/START domain